MVGVKHDLGRAQRVVRMVAPLAVAMTLCACGRSSPANESPARADASAVESAIPAVASGRPSARRSASTATASATPLPALEPVPCPLDELGASFLDCNPKPSQRGYPECYAYTIVAASSPAPGRCIPDEVTITVSGWPGVLDIAKAKAVPSEGGEVRLTLLPVAGKPPGGSFPKGAGAALGTLVVHDEKVAQWRRAKGLAHYTDRPLGASRP